MMKQTCDGHKVYMNGSYPAIYINGKNVHVHRYMWEKYYGAIPEGYIIHHKDENKLNWNINNLELLSRGKHVKEHAHNLHNESTRRFGEKSRNHKLTQKDVDFIKSVYKRYDKQFGAKALSEKFNVTPACICAISNGTNWGV